MAERVNYLLGIILIFICTQTAAEDKVQLPSNFRTPTSITIIIDDLGDRLDNGRRAVSLPGAVTLSFLPHARYVPQLTEMAHDSNKEIMLHLPMEAIEHHALGQGGLTLDMTREEFSRTFADSLASVPYASGINNHMGSLLTQHPGQMHWLMQEINKHGKLFFVDSRTTEASVAYRLATEENIPRLYRNIFLDNERDPDAIHHQFSRLVSIARKYGHAVAIGHPYPETLTYLETQLPLLKARGIDLIAASTMIKRMPEIAPTTTVPLIASTTIIPDSAKNNALAAPSTTSHNLR